MGRTQSRLSASCVLTLSALLCTPGCLLFGLADDGPDSEYVQPDDWDITEPEGAMLPGSKLTLSMTGPMSCSGGVFGIGGSCDLSTIDEVTSDRPEVASVESSSSSHLDVRAGTPGVATISFRGTTPSGEETSGAVFVAVAEPTSADVSFYSACGENTLLEEVTFPPNGDLHVSVEFLSDDGSALVGGEVAAPLVLEPADAGSFYGLVIDGGTSPIQLDLSGNVAVDEVAIQLSTGRELARVALATANTIDGWRVETPTFNPNFVEYSVEAELTVGGKRICFDPSDWLTEVQYTVTYETPEICDGGFGETESTAVSWFTLEPKMAGDCVVRLTHGALTEVHTFPVHL